MVERCEEHLERKPCRGCAADRKAAIRPPIDVIDNKTRASGDRDE